MGIGLTVVNDLTLERPEINIEGLFGFVPCGDLDLFENSSQFHLA